MATLVAVVTTIAAALLLGVASVADQRSTKRVKKRAALSPRILLDLLRQPLWLLAAVANVAGFALQVVALSFGSLALVQPILASDLVFAVLLSWYLRKRAEPGPRRPGRNTNLLMFSGAAATAVGVAGFLAVGQPSGGTTHASLSTLPALVTLLVVTVGGCLAVGSRRHGLRPLALALACGVCYGVAAFCVKLVTSETGHGPGELFTDWPIYILLVVGPLGYLLNQAAFQQGRFLAPVQAIITAADPVISIALGIVWLNVTVRGSPLDVAGQVISLLVMIAGIVMAAQHAPAVRGRTAAAPSPRLQAGQPNGGLPAPQTPRPVSGARCRPGASGER